MSQSTRIMIFALLLLSITSAMNSPLWPQKFGIEFLAKIANFRTTGKYWYNPVKNAQKLELENGNILELCSTILPQNTPCSLMTINSKTYYIFPEKRLCCSQDGFPIKQQDWLQDFKYLGETIIQGEVFYEWESPQQAMRYYEDQSAQRIPRRESYANGRVEMNYLTSTYTEDFDTKDTFALPSYCKKKCRNFNAYEKKSQRENYQ